MKRLLLILISALATLSRVAAIEVCSPEASDSYVIGELLLGKRTARDLEEALEHFGQAIAADEDCAPAFAGRARAHALLFEYPEAREAALTALALDPDLAEAHAALGFVQLQADWDREGGEKSLRRAIALDPEEPTAHHWLAICLEVSGRGDQAVAAASEALRLAPASTLYSLNLGYRLFWARRYEQAAEQFSKTLAMAPELASAHYFLGRTRVEQGKYAKAQAEFDKAEKLSPGDWNPIAARGYLFAKSGRSDEALAIAGELQRLVTRGYPFRSQIASIYTSLGDPEQALDWLDRALAAHEGPLLWLEVDPRFDPLRSDPRFAELLGRTHPKSRIE